MRLGGNPRETPPVWVETAGGERPSVLWPSGFYARFAPDLELYSGDGRLVARAGDELDLGGGQWAGTDSFYACQIKGVWYAWPPT